MAKHLTFDVKLALAILAIKARDESLSNAEIAKGKAISELNELIRKRINDADVKKDDKKRLKILEINQSPLNFLILESGEKISINPVELRKLGDKYKALFSDLNATEVPAAS